MFSLKGKNAIVTGAGSGIGQAIAKSLAAQGAVVDILDVNLEGAAETVSSIESDGGTAATHECDVWATESKFADGFTKERIWGQATQRLPALDENL